MFKIYLSLFYIFFYVSLNAAGENPIPVVDLEGEPSAYVCGCVNVISGDFVDSQCDIILPGIEPFALQRSYYSSDYRQGVLGRAWYLNYGATLHVGKANQGFLGTLEESNNSLEFYTPDEMGLEIGIAKSMLDTSVVNTSSGVIGGRTNIKNTKIIYPTNKAPYVFTGAGTYKYFQYVDYKTHLDKKYRITNEVFPSGDGITYEYQDNQLFAVVRRNTQGKNLASYQFHWKEDRSLLDVVSYDEKHVLYHFGKTGLLEKVLRPYAPWESYQYENFHHKDIDQHVKAKYYYDQIIRKEGPNNRFIEIGYYRKGDHDGSDKITGKDDLRLDRVKELRQPVGTDATPIVTHRFTYEVDTTYDRAGHPIALAGLTIVADALGNETYYEFNDDQRLIQIEKFKANGEVNTREVFFWGKARTANSTNLLVRVVKNESNVIYAKSYGYDDRGNVLTDRLWGTLSGANHQPVQYNDDGVILQNGCEYIDKNYSYSQGLNLILSETCGRQSTIYEYYPGNDKLKAKFYSGDNRIYKREFFYYNTDLALNKYIVDDGTSTNPEDLGNVTERFITYYTPRQTFPFGLPEIVEEKYLDRFGQERLIRKIINNYSTQGKLSSQAHFDSEMNHAYTLFWEYNDMGLVTKETDALGQTITRKYDENGNLIEEQGPRLDVYKKFDYDCMNRLVIEEVVHKSDNQRHVTHYAYDYLGNMTSTVNPYGHKTEFYYDEFGHPIKVIHPAVSNQWGVLYHPIETKQYDSLGNVISETDARGCTTTRTFNIRNQPLQVTCPDGTQEAKVYNLDGTVHKSVNRDGSYVIHTYDYAKRSILQQTFSQGHELLEVTKATYNSFHLTSETDSAGNVTTYEYLPTGKLYRKRKGDSETIYCYDSLGRLFKTYEAFGPNEEDYLVLAKEYDFLNRVVEERTEGYHGNVLNKVEYGYDVSGNLNKVVNHTASGLAVTTAVYDSHGNPTITDPEGNVTVIKNYFDHYNAYGQYVPFKVVVDPLGNFNAISLDTRGNENFIIRKNPYGKVLQKQEKRYDASLNPMLVIDTVVETGLEIKTYSIYDSCNRLEQIYEAWGSEHPRHTKIIYNNKGQKIQTIKPDGVLLTHTYDAFGRLATYSASDHSFEYTYEYDANHNPIKIHDAVNNTTTFKKYNIYNQVVHETLGNGLSLSYCYDRLDRTTCVTLPDQSTIEYEYHFSQLKKVKRPGYFHQYLAYDLSDKLLMSKLAGKAGEVNYAYDLLGRKRQTTYAVWSESLDLFDSAGNLLQKTVTEQGKSQISQFNYDELYQLKTETGPANHIYAHDSIYNRTEKDGMSLTYSCHNLLLSEGEDLYSYDANGNLTQRRDENYSYDALDRLVSYTNGDRQTKYQYDSENRRLSKTHYRKVGGN